MTKRYREAKAIEMIPMIKPATAKPLPERFWARACFMPIAPKMIPMIPQMLKTNTTDKASEKRVKTSDTSDNTKAVTPFPQKPLFVG